MRFRDPLREHGDLDDVLRAASPFVRVVDDVLGSDECDALIARIEALGPTFAPITTGRGFVERPDVRNNDRVIFDDVELARALFGRVTAALPMVRYGEHPEDRRGQAGRDPRWDAIGFNERFRGYRYRPGQRFAPHFDGAFVRDDAEQSAITVLVYLNDGCVGGETRILDWGCTVVPRRGSMLLFDHHILHEGAEVVSGSKYALRSDVMFRRAEAGGGG